MSINRGRDKPLGHQFAMALLSQGPAAVARVAAETSSDLMLNSFLRVQEEEPELAFLHSALCAMSLPARRPKDETAPIIREDGKYALAINPKPVLQMVDGKPVMKSLGVPFGSYPRVALIYMLSEAVRNQSRDVYLGKNFTEWMRRLGYKTISYGPRGSANLLKEQVDRLLACEWQIRWDDEKNGDTAFAVKEVKLSNEYAGSLSKGGEFGREIRLSDVFFNHLLEHAVPLNEVAIRELKEKPVALDLYCYLAYRLPRVTSDKGQMISWEQLAKHLGNDCDPRRFKQTIRETMNLVSAVYPNANIDLSGRVVKLFPSPKPDERKLVGGHLRSVGRNAPTSSVRPKVADGDGHVFPDARTSSVRLAKIGEIVPALTNAETGFPLGSLHYGGAYAKPFLEIARARGGGWDVDDIADAYRKAYSETMKNKDQAVVLRSWEGFCCSFVSKRGPAR
jgi:hypothetical protein